MLAYPTKSKQVCQEELVKKWNEIKNDTDLQVKVDHWLQELKAISIIPPKRIMPQRVAARRQRELMVIIANEENGESVDWIEEEELDLNGISIPQDEQIRALPIYSIKEHFASPWENGKA